MKNIKPHFHRQQGVSLIELLIGLSIGLLVIGVATGALMASRGISGTVSDATTMQQQAAYAMRVIGQQLRQAGSLYLEMTPAGYDNAVVFLLRDGDILEEHAADKFTSSFSSDATDLSKHCLGGPATSQVNDPIKSAFALNADTNSLRCNDQPILGNVADFQVRYLVQKDAVTGATNITYTDNPGENDQIQGVEICLVLYGTETINLPDGASYQGCGREANGSPQSVDMTTLPAPRTNRLHLAFRNVFQLRSQGEL